MLKNQQLTQRIVDHCTEIGRKPDHKKPALFLLTRPGNKQGQKYIRKYWMMRVQVNGTRTDISVGNAATMTLKKARDKVDDLAVQIQRGNDPRVRTIKNIPAPVVRPTRRDGEMPTFIELAEEVHAHDAPEWTKGYARQWISDLKCNAGPILHKPVNEITTGDIYNLLKKPREINGKVIALWTDKHPTAKTTRGKINKILGRAAVHGYISQNPAGENLKGQLGNARHIVQHHRSLPHDQVGDSVRAVWNSTASMQTKICLSFIVLTACRGKEARFATWDEIDLDNRVWVIPAHRMKSRREHTVPLSDQAIKILKMASKLLKDPFINWEKMFADNERRIIPKIRYLKKIVINPANEDARQWVFPSKQEKPVSEATLPKMLKTLGIHTDVHGYRASFRTWCSKQRIDRELAELSLAHKFGDDTEQSYNHTTLIEQRREVMQDWADYLTKTKGEAE